MGNNIENEEWREEAPTLSGLQKSGDFSVPLNYFEELSANIQAKAALENLKAIANENAFEVPDGYFDQMRSDILAKTQAPSRIIKLWHSNLLKYASAACFVLVAGLGVYFNQEQPQQAVNYADIATEQMLFDIDEDVIIEHIEGANSVSQQVTADQADLENYILTNFSTTELTAEY